MYATYVKRAIDAVAALLLLVVIAPTLLVIAMVVRTWLGSPVFFIQRRPGLKGRPFDMVKFRTMTAASDSKGPQNDADRLTPVGTFLRATSLDELPELWNVLRGDMSLVGPRPLLMQYLDRYTPAQARRHDVRPGITGLAQVSGRNELEWEARFMLDVEYVDRCSAALDARILLRTVSQVACARGIRQPGHATAQEFLGSSAR
jgi:lipopolysaccharide/colanic/teichoic acid biosynthesis glycosyltransferase